jgi:hypothetical protein
MLCRKLFTVTLVSSCVLAIASNADNVPSTYHPQPCPSVATVPEPPPCVHASGNALTCTAPGPYWFVSKYGLGCAGAISGIIVDMVPVIQAGTHKSRYILKFNLYTGLGFEKDQDGFHIDALLSDGSVYRDILTLGSDNSPSTGGLQLDLQHCHDGAGQDFRMPPPPAGALFNITPFDITKYDILSILIRVDPAINVGWSFRC